MAVIQATTVNYRTIRNIKLQRYLEEFSWRLLLARAVRNDWRKATVACSVELRKNINDNTVYLWLILLLRVLLYFSLSNLFQLCQRSKLLCCLLRDQRIEGVILTSKILSTAPVSKERHWPPKCDTSKYQTYFLFVRSWYYWCKALEWDL